MTNYEKIAQVAAQHVGLTLDNAGWKELVFQTFPETRAKASSIMPNDLRFDSCKYGDKVFSGEPSRLTALPVAERILKTSATASTSRGASAEVIAAAVAKAIAEYAAKQATATPVTPAVAPQAQAQAQETSKASKASK